jgi:hypothetical protein
LEADGDGEKGLHPVTFVTFVNFRVGQNSRQIGASIDRLATSPHWAAMIERLTTSSFYWPSLT